MKNWESDIVQSASYIFHVRMNKMHDLYRNDIYRNDPIFQSNFTSIICF